jgi:hypothetical protein
MRIFVVVISVVASVFLVTCSAGGGGAADPYAEPDMGGPSSLPAGNGTPVASVAAGVTLLGTAMGYTSSMINAAGPSGSVVGLPSKALLMGKAAVGSPKAFSATTVSEHVTFSPNPLYPGVSVTGSADVSFVNWPMGTLAPGDSPNGTLDYSQQVTITADHVSLSSGAYVLSGREVSNANMTAQMKGIYPDIAITGEMKVGFGLACTVVDTSPTGASAKFIVSFSAKASLDGSFTPTYTGTVKIYDATTNALIGSQTLTGGDLNELVQMFGLGM